MRLDFWVHVFLVSSFIGKVNSRLTKSTRVENDVDVRHHRKLIQADSEDAVSGSYIVHFKNDTTHEQVKQMAKEIAAQTGGKILWIYREIFKGFAISGLSSDNHIATILGRNDIEVMDQVCCLSLSMIDDFLRAVFTQLYHNSSYLSRI
jgi:hypothetical protein